ncbi:MAG: transcriptional regulator [Clostridiales bacterium GWC2_40_7]|nr:MAG: transcriptional regulator [Clostridiales bacterium GWC2_40_7]
MAGKYSDRYKRIGQRIQYYRKKAGFTQQELADKISISLSYLTKIEAQNCDKPFSLEVLFEICDALQIPVLQLLEDI